MSQKISIIVPTVGRIEPLRRTLLSLIHQDYDPASYEVLVIENGARSGAASVTDELIREFGCSNLRYYFEAQPGLLAGRHRGMCEAGHELLTFVDDDICADAEWLQAISDAFRSSDVQLVGGRNLPEFNSDPPGWLDDFWFDTEGGGRACFHLSLSDLGGSCRDIHPNLIWGLNFSIRKDALVRLGGFHPDGFPRNLLHFRGDGETGLAMKAKEAGARCLYQPLAKIRHIVPASRLTPRYFVSRSYSQGISDSYSVFRSLVVGVADTKVSGAIGRSFSIQVLAHRVRAALKRIRYGGERSFSGELDIVLGIGDSADARETRARMDQAYRLGYDQHQALAKSCPQLMDWVLRSEYWDYSLPNVNVSL